MRLFDGLKVGRLLLFYYDLVVDGDEVFVSVLSGFSQASDPSVVVFHAFDTGDGRIG